LILVRIKSAYQRCAHFLADTEGFGQQYGDMHTQHIVRDKRRLNTINITVRKSE